MALSRELKVPAARGRKEERKEGGRNTLHMLGSWRREKSRLSFLLALCEVGRAAEVGSGGGGGLGECDSVGFGVLAGSGSEQETEGEREGVRDHSTISLSLSLSPFAISSFVAASWTKRTPKQQLSQPHPRSRPQHSLVEPEKPERGGHVGGGAAGETPPLLRAGAQGETGCRERQRERESAKRSACAMMKMMM